MSDNDLKRFSFADVDFSDEASVASVYGSGGGLWRREEVTILSSYYHPDIFEKRHTKDGNPECGLVLNFHFHNPERQAEIAKRDADKRHWMTSARYGFGRYFLDRGGVLYKADDTPVDVNAATEEDLHAEYFKAPPGAVWNRGSFMEFHQALDEVNKHVPAELATEWKKLYESGGASAFTGLRCYLSQVDVEVDAKTREAGEKRIEEAKAQMIAEGRPQADIDRLRWYAPKRVFIDEIVGFEDVDSLAAYDPNAVVITPRAIEFIKAKINDGVVKMADIGMQALNENADIHPEVVAALDVSVLAQHGITWANQRLSLAG